MARNELIALRFVALLALAPRNFAAPHVGRAAFRPKPPLRARAAVAIATGPGFNRDKKDGPTIIELGKATPPPPGARGRGRGRDKARGGRAAGGGRGGRGDGGGRGGRGDGGGRGGGAARGASGCGRCARRCAGAWAEAEQMLEHAVERQRVPRVAAGGVAGRRLARRPPPPHAHAGRRRPPARRGGGGARDRRVPPREAPEGGARAPPVFGRGRRHAGAPLVQHGDLRLRSRRRLAHRDRAAALHGAQRRPAVGGELQCRALGAWPRRAVAAGARAVGGDGSKARRRGRRCAPPRNSTAQFGRAIRPRNSAAQFLRNSLTARPSPPQ